MKRVLTTVLLAIGMTTGAEAQEPAPTPAPPPPFEVVRPGDTTLACEAIIGEINELNRQMQTIQESMMAAGQDLSRESMMGARRGAGGGLLTGLGGLAAGLVPGGGLVMGAVQALGQESAAASVRSQQENLQRRMQTMNENTAMLGPISQRAAHLAEIARDRSC